MESPAKPGEQPSNLVRVARCAGLAGALAASALVFSVTRYLSLQSGGILVNSGPHAAAGIFMGALSNLTVEFTNGKERFPLRHALTGAIITGLATLAINHSFELFGHPIDEVLNPDNPRIMARRQGEVYGDWVADDILTSTSSALAYFTTAAMFKFGAAKSKIRNLKPQRSVQA